MSERRASIWAAWTWRFAWQAIEGARVATVNRRDAEKGIYCALKAWPLIPVLSGPMRYR